MAGQVKILVDSREQNPWEFPGVRCVKCALSFGDYAVAGSAHRRAVERKSSQDFVGSITTGRARFLKEFDRAREAGARILLVVEASYGECEAVLAKYQPSRAFRKTLASFMDESGSTPVFTGTRERAKALALAWLTENQ